MAAKQDIIRKSTRVLERLDLDRPLLIKEKLYCIIADKDDDSHSGPRTMTNTSGRHKPSSMTKLHVAPVFG
jgi:hypothetical protein